MIRERKTTTVCYFISVVNASALPSCHQLRFGASCSEHFDTVVLFSAVDSCCSSLSTANCSSACCNPFSASAIPICTNTPSGGDYKMKFQLAQWIYTNSI